MAAVSAAAGDILMHRKGHMSAQDVVDFAPTMLSGRACLHRGVPAGDDIWAAASPFQL